MRSISVNYEDEVFITLTRPSIADGRVRRELWKALAQNETAAVFGFFITQLVACEGLNFVRMSVYPGPEAAEGLFERFTQEVDEALYEQIAQAINQLNDFGSDSKKKSEPQPANTPQETTPKE